MDHEGRRIVFTSRTNLAGPPDAKAFDDVFLSDRLDPAPNAYCTAKPNSQGCIPSMASTGTPSASNPAPFDVRADLVLNNKLGILFYSLAPNRMPYQGATLCIAAPLKRCPPLTSGGNPPPNDCSGVFHFDFNARIQSGVDPNLVPGTVVFSQYLYRDPQDPTGFASGLTNGLRFAIQP